MASEIQKNQLSQFESNFIYANALLFRLQTLISFSKSKVINKKRLLSVTIPTVSVNFLNKNKLISLNSIGTPYT